ncbi:MAG TPA: hypothetical protein VJB56_01365 [Candidatus Paceibacterota bacterium]
MNSYRLEYYNFGEDVEDDEDDVGDDEDDGLDDEDALDEESM